MKIIAILTLLAGAEASLAQPLAGIAPQNVVQLSAVGTVEVAQDLLLITLNTTREGNDAHAVQTQLKAALEAALMEARQQEKAGLLEVRTGNFNLSPRWGRDGKTNGWQGQAELVLEGQDFTRITATAGKVRSLTVSRVSFGLSLAQRTKVERDAQSLAIERFKAQASDIARSFGFTGYTLREVSVNAQDQGGEPRPRMMAMKTMDAMADAPLPVEVGKTSVVVTVSGSVQLK